MTNKYSSGKWRGQGKNRSVYSNRLFLPGLFVSLMIIVAFREGVDEKLSLILRKFIQYHENRPQEKVYLHLDKPVYTAGDDIWFKVYLTNGQSLALDSSSKVLYVELFSPDRKRLKSLLLYAPGGTAQGDFHLPETIQEGTYQVRAYTNYMRNQDEGFFFHREIFVVNPLNRKQRALSSSAPSIDLQFFPEGGDLLTNVNNLVAFKAVDSNGKGLYVEGDIVDETNKVVTTFKSEYNGMGAISIFPFASKRYSARVRIPSAHIFMFPAVSKKGFVLNVSQAVEKFRVTIYSNLKEFSPDPCPVYLVAHSRGKICFAASGEIVNRSMIINIPKSRLPSGIVHITIFDGALQPQCERLVFVNHSEALKLSIKPDKSVYGVHDKVVLDITVANRHGEPMPGNFSLAVYDEHHATPLEEHSLNIYNYQLLTSDLKGAIENPGYYLKDTLSETKRHLDLLMLTQGWRRFIWRDVLADTLHAQRYLHEQGIVVSGTLTRSLAKRQRVKGAELKLLTMQGDLMVMRTDTLGRFYADRLLYYDTMDLVVQLQNESGNPAFYNFNVNPFQASPDLTAYLSDMEIIETDELWAQALRRRQIMALKMGKDIVLLDEVKVTSTRIKEQDQARMYTPDATIKMKDVPAIFTDIYQVIQGRLPGVMVSGSPPFTRVSIQGRDNPLFLLNGMVVDSTMISNIVVGDVESIDLLQGANASIYGGRGGNGVIAIYTKSGGGRPRETPGIHRFKHPGFYKARQFYSPRYDATTAGSEPDIRSTLYWDPHVITSQEGKAQVSFYASDVISSYRIIMEGVGVDGTPGTGSSTTATEGKER